MLRRTLAAALLLPGLMTGVAATGLATASSAAAECTSVTNPITGEVTYTCTGSTPGHGGSGGTPGGSGGSSQPTCDLTAHPDATWCRGTDACLTKPTTPPVPLATGPKPSPDSESMTDWCYSGGLFSPIRTYWSDTAEPAVPPLAEQAEEATGNLDLALPALSTSPANRTLVTVPTWYWVAGAQPTQTGSSAFGLVAIATIKTLNVTTGDGGTLACPWTTSAEQAAADCQHLYTRTSYDGTATWQGRPAYAVSASATWDIHFEMDGVRIDIPGQPGTLTGPATTAVLRVDEVQTLVTGAR